MWKPFTAEITKDGKLRLYSDQKGEKTIEHQLKGSIMTTSVRPKIFINACQKSGESLTITREKTIFSITCETEASLTKWKQALLKSGVQEKKKSLFASIMEEEDNMDDGNKQHRLELVEVQKWNTNDVMDWLGFIFDKHLEPLSMYVIQKNCNSIGPAHWRSKQTKLMAGP